MADNRVVIIGGDAAGMTAGMTVMDLIDLDQSYAPPFSLVRDPIQTAARQLFKKI